MGNLPYIKITAENGETLPEDVLRNIETLMNAQEGEQETDRDYGINWNAVDRSAPEAERILTLSIISKIPKYETRCRVTHVDFDYSDAAEVVSGISGVEVFIST